jgi:hypothetical protein
MSTPLLVFLWTAVWLLLGVVGGLLFLQPDEGSDQLRFTSHYLAPAFKGIGFAVVVAAPLGALLIAFRGRTRQERR